VSDGTTAPLRTLAFGDLATGVWGCAWSSAAALLAIGRPETGARLEGAAVSIGGSCPGEEWTVSGEGVELVVSPKTEAASSSAIDGFHQLCRVHGAAALDGVRREFDIPGSRSTRADLDPRRFESVREVCAWFASGDGIALTSLRPRGAKGHDRDVISATVFEAGGPIAVADPRLSTTYSADGHPGRVGLELWLDQDDSEEQYPRRAAAEPLGAAATWAQSTAELDAYLLRWLSRGEEGLGVYVLGRTR
jgi:hypothetical protein